MKSGCILFPFDRLGGANSTGLLMYPGQPTVVLPVQGSATRSLLSEGYLLNITNAPDLAVAADGRWTWHFHFSQLYCIVGSYKKSIRYLDLFHTKCDVIENFWIMITTLCSFLVKPK